MVRTLHDDWPIKFGENIPEQSSQTFGSQAILAMVAHFFALSRHNSIEFS